MPAETITLSPYREVDGPEAVVTVTIQYADGRRADIEWVANAREGVRVEVDNEIGEVPSDFYARHVLTGRRTLTLTIPNGKMLRGVWTTPNDEGTPPAQLEG